MSSTMGWIVALALIVAGGVYFFWYIPQQEAQTTQGQASNTQQSGTTEESSGNPQFVGTWRSNSDAKFTRDIRADGVIVDRYEGEASAGLNGEWTVVNPDNLSDDPVLQNLAESTFRNTIIKVVWEGGIETTYFAVTDVSGTSLTTTDLTGRGAVTVYTRI